MFSRSSTRWLAPIVILAICGVSFAYNRIITKPAPSEPIVSVAAGTPVSVRDQLPAIIRVHECTGNWLIVKGDDFLPNGVALEICEDGYIGQVSAAPGPDVSKLVGSRYVVGDIDATDITRQLWRSIDFEMHKPDGSIAELSALRPLWWIEETGAKTGETIDLGMHEIGISGPAKVMKIGPCDVDSRENTKESQIVTGKIKHHNAEVWELVFNNDTAKPLGVTANHPIMSADRKAWVAAGELRIDERVQTTDGTATLTGKSKHPTRETVYNLEVHRSHTYHVSQFGILAHNSSLVDCSSILKPGGQKLGIPGTSDQIRIVSGGVKEAEDMFLDLATKGKGIDVTPKGLDGMMVKFPDGGQIRYRPTSTSGPPTIDVIIKGLGIREIKFIP